MWGLGWSQVSTQLVTAMYVPNQPASEKRIQHLANSYSVTLSLGSEWGSAQEVKERLKATWPNFWIRLNNEDLAQRDGRCPISLPEYINVGEKSSPGCCWLVAHAARSYPVNTRAVRRRSNNSLFEDDIEEVNAHWRGGGQLAGEGERDPHSLASLRVTCQFCDLGTAAGKGYSKWSEHRSYAAAVYA